MFDENTLNDRNAPPASVSREPQHAATAKGQRIARAMATMVPLMTDHFSGITTLLPP
jgi:hypothetical protein